MTDGSRRLFVAIALPPEVREALASSLGEVARLAPRAKVVPPENLHVTLRFLGRTEAAEVPAVESAIAQAAAGGRPFDTLIAGAHSFGPLSRPRVLWGALPTGGEAIAALAEKAACALGLAPEDRFTPHVTLARARDPRGDPSLAQAREALAGLFAGPLTVRSLALFESHLGRAGPRYEILREVPFPP